MRSSPRWFTWAVGVAQTRQVPTTSVVHGAVVNRIASGGQLHSPANEVVPFRTFVAAIWSVQGGEVHLAGERTVVAIPGIAPGSPLDRRFV